MPPALHVAAANQQGEQVRFSRHLSPEEQLEERSGHGLAGKMQDQATAERQHNEVMRLLRESQSMLDSILQAQKNLESMAPWKSSGVGGPGRAFGCSEALPAQSPAMHQADGGPLDSHVPSLSPDWQPQQQHQQQQHQQQQHQQRLPEEMQEPEQVEEQMRPEDVSEQGSDTLDASALVSIFTDSRAGSKNAPCHLEPRCFLTQVSNAEQKRTGLMRSMSAMSLIEQKSESVRCRCRPIHPDCSARMFLDVFGIVLLLFDSIMVPYMIAWAKGLESAFFLYSTWVAMLYWTFEIICNFVTGFIENQVLVTSFRRIAWRYLSTWFFVDISVVGIDWISMALHVLDQDSSRGSGGASHLKIMRLLKITRLVRVLAVASRSGHIARIQETAMRRAQALGINLHCQFALGLSKLVFVILWLNHLGTCFWWVFVNSVPEFSDTGTSWHDDLAHEVGVNSLEDSTDLDAYWYLAGMYWSVTAMFSGGSLRSPNNSAEAAFSASFVVFGMLFGSTLISLVAAMLVDFQMVQRAHNEKLRTLRKFLQQHCVDPNLSIRVQNQVLDRLKTEKRLACQDVPVLKVLSAHLRDMLWCDIYTPILQTQLVLHMCDLVDDALLSNLCLGAVTTHVTVSGDQLFGTGTHINQAYALIGGIMQYTHADALSETVEVRATTWLCELTLWTHWTTTGLAEAVTSGELVVLRVDGLLQVVSSHPEAIVLMRDYSNALCRLISQERVALSDLRSQIQLDEDHIICALPRETRLHMSLPALRSLREAAGPNNVKQMKALEALEAEIRDGKCYLTNDAGGCVLRVVHVATLKLHRFDGMLCVKVGDWDAKESRVVPGKAKLPGTKMRAGELPRQTVERLLAQEFAELKLRIRQGVSVEVEHAPSESYGVTTKYVRTVVSASCLSIAARPGRIGDSVTRTTELEHEGSMYCDIEYWPCQPSPGKSVPLYAWVPEGDFPELSNSDVLGRGAQDLAPAILGSCEVEVGRMDDSAEDCFEERFFSM